MRVERDFRRVVRDAAPVVLVLALCPVVSLLAPGPQAPVARIAWLVGAERSLGLFFEPAVHEWAAARPWLLHAANAGYVGVHLPVMLGALTWVWLARPGAFRLARNTFVATQALLVAGYALAPTAPPRMMASLGYGGAGAGTTGLERVAMSPYAAMPSGHAAFAVIAAGILVTLARHRLTRVAALAYPPAILLETFATGNHIWLDAAAGMAAAAAGFATARAIESRAPVAESRGDRMVARRAG